MDLAFGSRDAATKGAWLHLEHPVSGEPLFEPNGDGKPDKSKPVRWLIAGQDSDQYAKYQMHQQTQRIQEAARTRGKWTPDAAKSVEEAINLLAACVLGWEHTGFEGENAVPCTFETACKIIKKEPWTGEQVAGFMGDRAHFFQSAVKP